MNTHPKSPVTWSLEGHPRSEQFNDIYHTTSGALEQANHVFLSGCKLPHAWQNQPQHIILETGFGLGLNFLATWLKWQQDPNRCKRLHFVSVEAYPVAATDIAQALKNIPELQTLGTKLVKAYPAALPGLHRLEFIEDDSSAIILTLAIGDARQLLPQLQLQANTLFLDGFSPAKNPDLWGADICAHLARLAKPGARIATWCVAGDVKRNLESAGFAIERVAGLPPKREALTGTFQPKSLSRRAHHAISTQAGAVFEQKNVTIIGAGFAGATLAWSLARRGWKVHLVDKAPHAAAGASGLPMGLGVPNVSQDDALLTQITRAGAQWLRYVVRACNLEQKYWSDSPVEQLVNGDEDDGKNTIPLPWGELGSHIFEPRLTDEDQPCRHFHQGMRLEGPAFIQALLKNAPNLTCQWHTEITRIEQNKTTNGNNLWLLYDQHGQLCAQSPHVIVAAGMGSLPLLHLENKSLTPNRGQITLGLPDTHFPDNVPDDFLDARTGHGHFLLPQRPHTDWSWSMGSTFEHNCSNKDVLPASHQEIFEKLLKLSPKTAALLRSQFEEQKLGAFVEIRCTSSDHLPMVGAVPDLKALAKLDASKLMNEQCPVLPGLFVLTALGSRGLNAGPLCAELLASMMNGEPWPLTKPQTQALLPARFELRQQRKT